ncbi:MAG: alanine racemase [Oscillospiraceae bacterium]|nr:alanine racemase [Oscillospiraceae bacterium]
MNTYVVRTELLSHNIEYLKKQARGVPIWAVIKGDGYGLGALPLAELLAEHGIEHFCVTDLREAKLLRENGFDTARILMLRSVTDPGEISRLLDLRVILTVGSLETARRVEQAAAGRADIAEVHIKIDTGMGRYGFLPAERGQIISVYREMKHLAVSGIYTHFNCAFADDALTRQEFAMFRQVVEALHAEGLETGCVHCCNSSAFLKFPEMHCDGVRLGSAILGRMAFPTKLRPVGHAESEVEELRTLPKGHTTGYAAVWKAKRDTLVAIVPVGWYHGLYVTTQPDMTRMVDRLRGFLAGLKRLLRPQRRTVEINGKRCNIIGAIGMLHCAVDVSGLDCKLGDRVVLQINPLQVKGMPVQFK